MSGWSSFWYGVICVALTAYFGLAFVIAIGGFFDVRRMFRRLKEAHAHTPDATGSEGRSRQ